MNHPLVGKSYVFEDGSKIEVIEVKQVDPSFGSVRVFYFITTGAGIPRKLVMSMDEFKSNYSHLFKDVEK